MGKHHSIDCLAPAQLELVKQCIRAHRYMLLDSMLAALCAQGIEGISRSALSRYVPRLKAEDSLKADTDEETIITIVERSTGAVRIIKTGASAATVAAQIEKLRRPAPLSLRETDFPEPVAQSRSQSL